jgi:hypothetical protein
MHPFQSHYIEPLNLQTAVERTHANARMSCFENTTLSPLCTASHVQEFHVQLSWYYKTLEVVFGIASTMVE